MTWYRGLLRIYGLLLMTLGFVFFILVYPLGAPVVPWLGLVIAFLGAWLGFSPTPETDPREPQAAAEKDN